MIEDKYKKEEEQYNADDKTQVNRARKKAKREETERQNTIRGIMSLKDCRKWIYHILSMGDMFGNPHVRGDAYDTAYNLGMQNLAKFIWMEIEDAAPESTMLMRKEAKENEKE